MFRHIIYESWSVWVPCVAFAVTAGVFLYFAAQALRLRKERGEELSRLPLDG
jgi:membrane protein implicated in regulation of membrane protease activity